MGSTHRSGLLKRSNESTRLIVTTILGVVFGFLVGISFPNVSVTKLNLTPSVLSSIDIPIIHGHTSDKTSRDSPSVGSDESKDSQVHGSDDGLKRFLFVETGYWSPGGCVLLDDSSRANVGISICDLGDSIGKIYVATNPRGAELLPPGIVVSETDFYLRRLWGDPSEDLKTRPRYLVTFTVGFAQRNNINAAIRKFSDDFTIVLFHYDGRASEWDQFEWSRRAIHISAWRQTKWWYAKRFLHPDVVAAYDYIFIWDEDLGVEHFNAEKYLELVKKYGLEISQPGLEPDKGLTWEMTKRRGDREVHKETTEKPGWCSDPLLPPCAAFVEIMAPVFSREAWRCVWHMIQNDLVHGWGLDFALRRCVEPAHEKIGVIDSQWIIHQVIPSLGSQGESERGKAPWEGVRDRCKSEWSQFQARLAAADRAYLAEVGRG